ncbi:centaurin/arf [Anaeramoeba flamelloides]|uniref:Centaurin/arf n=1 Tax=Anaeramoeba flamelloides TaxID=1746091 RepID=A0ABQ8Y9B9_9EUKA|nr:centaurin/arf [Anaeramoeba flamelloides]
MEVNIEEICQDSPQFNLKIKKHEQEVEVLLENLIRILQVSQKFTKSATKFSNIGNEFANEITNFQANEITTTLDNQVSSLLQTCSLKLQEINQTRVLIFTQIENLLVQPVEEFITNDIGPVKRARLKLDQLTIEKKSLTKKVQEQKNNRELITQLGEIEKQYLLTKFELVSNLHKIQAKKKFDMVERIAAIIYSQLTFFHSGYDSLTEIENQMRDLVLELEGVKVNYEKKIQEDNQKKQNLLTILEEKKKKSAIQQKKQTQRLRPQPQQQQKKQKVMEKKGSLFKKSESGNKEWEKKFFSIKNNRIYYINTQNNSRKIESLDLRLCTVKQINDNNTKNCFEVLGKEKKYLLQSETSQERLDWIEVIKNNILPSHNQEGTTKPNTTQSTRPQPKKTIPNQNNEKNLQILKLFQTIRGNNICADCSRENPQWCSITHGVLICDDCSSIHRTLGEDISKVKSILSSEWKEESIELIKELGNLRVNSIYERKLIRRKPTINSILDYKKTFITEKYKEKKYLQKLGSSAELNEKLYNSIQNNKLFDSFFCIAYGANPNWKNAKRQNQTSLHHAIASCNKSIINLLLISGSRFDIIDSNMQTPLHIAVKNRKIELVKRFIDLGHWLFPPAVDQNFKTAYNLAQELNFTEACLLLKDSYQKEKSIKKIEMKQQDQRLFQQQELELNEKRKQFLSLLPMNTRPKNDAPELPPKKYQDFDSLWPYYLTNPLVKEFVSSVGEQIKTTKQNKTVVKK